MIIKRQMSWQIQKNSLFGAFNIPSSYTKSRKNSVASFIVNNQKIMGSSSSFSTELSLSLKFRILKQLWKYLLGERIKDRTSQPAGWSRREKAAPFFVNALHA